LKHLALSGDLARDIALAFDASPNPYMLLTPDMRYAGMNQAYLDAVGRTRDDLLGKYIFDVFDGGGPDPAAKTNVERLRESLEHVAVTGERDLLPLIHYPIETASADGSRRVEDRWWSATHTPVRNATGDVVYILQHTQDVTEIERLRRRVGDEDRTTVAAMLSGDIMARAEHLQQDNRRLQTERNRLLDMFLQAPGFIAVLTGPEHVFQMHNAAYAELVGRDDLDGKSLRDALPEIRDQGFVDLLDEVRRTGEPFRGQAVPVQLARAGRGALETVYLDFIYQPLRDADGTVAGVFVQGHDVTDAVLADRRQRLMIDELNHRVKNTLATVQSIAMQTARSHAEPERFAESFQSRLLALSHTHDLLTRSHWEGADLHEVLEHETEAHGRQRVLLNGPVVALKPSAALSLGMVFHELATNAAKYGALSLPEGRVTVDWTVDADARMTVTWRETGGPPASPPGRRGFGSRLIERSVRHDLGGEITMEYGDRGLAVVMAFQVDSGRS
jgi:PAS domain S-box-containing protein